MTLQGTNCLLVGTGSRRLLIDTGEGNAAFKDSLKTTLSAQDASVAGVLLTHWHGDHVGGLEQVLEVVEELQGAEARDALAVFKRPHSDAEHEQVSTALPSGWYAPHQGEAEGGWADSEAAGVAGAASGGGSAAARRRLLPMQHGDTFAVEGATVTALETPGHTSDHTSFLLWEEDSMVVGDCVLGHGSTTFADLAKYTESLKDILAHKPDRIYCGHGQVIGEARTRPPEWTPDSVPIRRVALPEAPAAAPAAGATVPPVLPEADPQPGTGWERVEAYLQHRAQRESELLEQLRAAAASTHAVTSLQLAESIYQNQPGMNDRLLLAAARTVRLTLEKLLEDGAVVAEVGATGPRRWRVA